MKKKDSSSERVINILSVIKDRDLVREELSKKFFSLTFSPEVEKVFQDYYLVQNLKFIKISFLLGLLVYASFGILDSLLYFDVKKELWIIRFVFGCPVILFDYLLLNRIRKEPQLQLVSSILLFLIGLSIVWMLVITSFDQSQKYYAGLVLVVFYGYIALGLRFKYAVPAGWSITLSYFFLSSFFIKPQISFLIGNTFTLFFANIIGMIGNFLVEKIYRRTFLLSVLLNIERNKLEELNKELHKLSKTDPLTGLANRRYFETFLEEEWNRAKRYKYPISLLMIDIDFFKNYNDYLGHQEGDSCLKKIAEVLKEFERRPGDLAARYGGEEFVLILSGTRKEDAERIAEEIRKRVMGLRLSHPASTVSKLVTVSIGVASVYPFIQGNKEQLIKAADDSMYMAKAKGRNCVVCCEVRRREK